MAQNFKIILLAIVFKYQLLTILCPNIEIADISTH
jgi:hypothetical protein